MRKFEFTNLVKKHTRNENQTNSRGNPRIVFADGPKYTVSPRRKVSRAHECLQPPCFLILSTGSSRETCADLRPGEILGVTGNGNETRGGFAWGSDRTRQDAEWNETDAGARVCGWRLRLALDAAAGASRWNRRIARHLPTALLCSVYTPVPSPNASSIFITSIELSTSPVFTFFHFCAERHCSLLSDYLQQANTLIGSLFTS